MRIQILQTLFSLFLIFFSFLKVCFLDNFPFPVFCTKIPKQDSPSGANSPKSKPAGRIRPAGLGIIFSLSPA